MLTVDFYDANQRRVGYVSLDDAGELTAEPASLQDMLKEPVRDLDTWELVHSSEPERWLALLQTMYRSAYFHATAPRKVAPTPLLPPEANLTAEAALETLATPTVHANGEAERVQLEKLAEQLAPQLVSQFFNGAFAAWSQIATELRKTFAGSEDIALERDHPATNFILGWMRDLKAFQTYFGEKLFQRKKRPPAADDFTAAVAMTLEQFLAARGFPISVWSERATPPKRGAMLMDVSIWLNSNKLIATVECKTTLGWARGRWKSELESRTEAMREFCQASYLCVLTQHGWDSDAFLNSACFRKQWFCLYKHGPSKITDPILRSDIPSPIEPMFLGILQALRTEKQSL
jgi:hypothetical protein